SSSPCPTSGCPLSTRQVQKPRGASTGQDGDTLTVRMVQSHDPSLPESADFQIAEKEFHHTAISERWRAILRWNIVRIAAGVRRLDAVQPQCPPPANPAVVVEF